MGNNLECKLYYLVSNIKENISLNDGLLCSKASLKC